MSSDHGAAARAAQQASQHASSLNQQSGNRYRGPGPRSVLGKFFAFVFTLIVLAVGGWIVLHLIGAMDAFPK